jgi:O-antigen/teichoic acid export membrane protein
MSEIIRHIFNTTITRILLIGISFLQGIIIARYLLPEGRGIIAIYLAIVNMLMPFSQLGIKQSSAYFLNKANMSISNIINIQTITLIFSSFITFLFLIIIFYFQELTNNFVLILISLSIPLRIYISYSSGVMLANREINIINISQLLLILIDFLVVIILFVLLDMKAEDYFIAYFISSFICALYICVWLKNNYNISLSFDLQKYMQNAIPVVKKGITYALPLFVIGLNYSIDILILNYYVNKSEIGIYSIGVTLAILLWQFPNILSLLIFSYSVSTKDENQFSRNLWKKFKVIMLVMFPLSIVVTLLAKYFIPFIYGEAFITSFDVLIWLMPGVYMMIAFKLLNGDLAARGYPMIAFYIFLFAVILNIILNILLIPQIGINGAAIASSISYSIASIMFVYIYFKKIISIGEL